MGIHGHFLGISCVSVVANLNIGNKDRKFKATFALSLAFVVVNLGIFPKEPENPPLHARCLCLRPPGRRRLIFLCVAIRHEHVNHRIRIAPSMNSHRGYYEQKKTTPKSDDNDFPSALSASAYSALKALQTLTYSYDRLPDLTTPAASRILRLCLKTLSPG